MKKKQWTGMGDVVESFTEATGIKKLVDFAANGKDCGCQKRKEALNKAFPFKKESDT